MVLRRSTHHMGGARGFSPSVQDIMTATPPDQTPGNPAAFESFRHAPANPVVRHCLLALGFLMVGLGALGVFGDLATGFFAGLAGFFAAEASVPAGGLAVCASTLPAASPATAA